jgi:phospholipase/carboxylesterase
VRRAASRIYAAVLVLTATLAFIHLQPRAQSLPLETFVDGPAPAGAAGVFVFLHGRGGSIARSKGLVKRLREAGLPSDFSIVLLEGPFATVFGHAWGSDAGEQTVSRTRVRKRLGELLGAQGPPSRRILLAGFSQGAGVAGDVAVEEPRIGAVASLSPCAFWLRGALPSRAGIRVLLAHGSADRVCPVDESRSLAGALKKAGIPVQYLEFKGEHTIPPEVVRALVAFATAAD